MYNQYMTDKTVYFIRHGQTAENVGTTFQPPEAPLNDMGREQAVKIADRIAKLSFDVLLTSPFLRAKQTAEVISHTSGHPVEVSQLFHERLKPTSINGKPFADPVAHAVWTEWQESLYQTGMRVEDGENFDDLMARADSALEYLLKRPESTLVVVTHGFILMALVSRVLLGKDMTGEDFRQFRHALSMENTGLTVFQYGTNKESGETKWQLWVYNDHAHL